MLQLQAEMKAKLYAAVLSDVLDDLGYRQQVMHPSIRPLVNQGILMGRARTMLAVPEFEAQGIPLRAQMEATDALAEGDVVVAHTSQVQSCAFWGELFSTAALARGCRGAITDGYIRDTRMLLEMQFPVYSKGIYAVSSKGRMTVSAFDVPIACGGVLVRSGDIVFAEFDGIVVIPAAVADTTIERALDIVSKEDGMREALRSGLSMQAAWEKFRVL